MRRVSKSRAAFNLEANEWRERLKARVGRCEFCLLKADKIHLDCDEISRGCCRKVSLTAPYAILVLHRHCHKFVQNWSRAKRLAILLLARPEDYCLESFWQLTRRNWPDQCDVDVAAAEILATRRTA